MHRIRVSGHLGVISRRPRHPALTSPWTECEKCIKNEAKMPHHITGRRNWACRQSKGTQHSRINSVISKTSYALAFSTTSAATSWPVIITVLLVHTDHDAEHHGLTPRKETRRVKHPPAKPAAHATAQAATSATSKPAMDMQVPLST